MMGHVPRTNRIDFVGDPGFFFFFGGSRIILKASLPLRDRAISRMVQLVLTECLLFLFACFQRIDVRFIEYMPFDGNRWNFSKMVSYVDMLKLIKEQWPNIQRLEDYPNDTSKAYKVCFNLPSVLLLLRKPWEIKCSFR